MSGLWMGELLAAVDQKDQDFLSSAKTMGIDPILVARRLMHTAYRVIVEHSFFHADPHPANLIVLPGSRICFIDFGAIGRLSNRTRNVWLELQYHMTRYDVKQMVNCTVRFAGPLLPTDFDVASEAMGELYADWVRAVKSTDAEWWERSTAANQIRQANAASKYGIISSIEQLQFSRASLLYETIVMRLDKDIDPIREFKAYAQDSAKAARRRLRRAAHSRLGEPTRMGQLRFAQLADPVNQFAFKSQRIAEDPVRRFRNVSRKFAYTISMLLRILYLALILGALGLIADPIADWCCERQVSWSAISESAIFALLFWVLFLLATVVVVRRILMRVGEPDRRQHT